MEAGEEEIKVFEDLESPVSSGRLVTLFNFFILCSGGCCFNVFGKRNTDETTETTRGFDNPIARLGENAAAVPMSPIDVRALDPIVFEPLPSINVLTPLSSNFYNSLPRLDANHHHPPHHLRQTTVDSPSSSQQNPPSSNVLRSSNSNNSNSDSLGNNNVFYVEPPGDEPIKVSANSSSSQWITFSSSSNDTPSNIIHNEKSIAPSITTTTTKTATTTTKKTGPPIKLLVEEDEFLNTPSSTPATVTGTKKGSSQLLAVSVTVTAPTPSPGISLVVIPPTPTPISISTPTPIEKSKDSALVNSKDSTTTFNSNDNAVKSVSVAATASTSSTRTLSIDTTTPTINGTTNDDDAPETDIESIPLEVSVSTESKSVDDDKKSHDEVLTTDSTQESGLPQPSPPPAREEEKEKVIKNRKSHPMYRKTSTPNHSPTESDKNVSFGSENSSFFLRNEDVFEDFSMELTCSYSPIEKNPQAGGREWQPTLHENQSLVMMGASDEYGLKPYQRITTEFENEHYQPGIEEVVEPGSFNPTISTDVEPTASLFSLSNQMEVGGTALDNDEQPMSLTVSGTFDTILDGDHQKEPIVPRKLVFDDSSLLETSSSTTGKIVNNTSEGFSNSDSSWTTLISDQNKSGETDNVDDSESESGPTGFRFLEALDVTPFSNVGPSAPSTVIKSTSLITNGNLRPSSASSEAAESTGIKTDSQLDEVGIGDTKPPKILFKLGQDISSSCTLLQDGHHRLLVDSGPASRDKFVEDIEAAAEEMGSLVLTDLEEDNPTTKVVKETREVEEESYEEGIGKIQRGNLFEMSSQQGDDDVSDGVGCSKNAATTAHENGSEFTTDLSSEVEEVEGDGGEISYLALNHSVEIVKDRLDNSRTLLVADLDDSDNEDENDDDESICRDIKDFVPSKWNQNLAPVKPAISQRSSVKSPEQQKFASTDSTDDTNQPASSTANSSFDKSSSSLKKSVSFERKKTQLIYEYPPPPPASDSDEDEKHTARSLAESGGHFNLSLDWELQPDELDHQTDALDDWEDEIVHSRTDKVHPSTENRMDMYRISGFDNFQVRPSKEPFVFQSVPLPPPRLAFPSSSSSSLSSSSTPTWTTPTTLSGIGVAGLGELRHTRERLKLDLSKGEAAEASLLDSEVGDIKSSTVKLQQLDSGVGSGSSTNVTPFDNCDNH